LEFTVDGATAPEFFAIDNGIYRNLGLDVTPEGSSGSGDSVNRVATGTYAFGMADASTLVEFACKNPKSAPKLLMPIYDRFPAVILSFSKKPIKSLKELAGIKLGVGTADAGSKLLPALLALNKIDSSSIHFVTLDVKLRDAMLLKGAVDAVVAFDYTAVFNLMRNGVKLKDINLLYYSQYGFDFFGNSLIVNPQVAAKNPDLVRRMTLAVAQSWIAASKDRDGAIAAVMKRNQLLDAKNERARLDWLIDRLVLTKNVRANGLGAVDPARVKRSIEFIKNGLNLPTAPTVDQFFDAQFMPSAKERKII
jgi:NitT/TauT family transport system substrate-binding protein